MSTSSPVVVIAHSLGGVATVDLLLEAAKAVDTALLRRVSLLVTAGSQAPFFYEINALKGLDANETFPDGFPNWLNLFDSLDLLSFVAEGVFPGRVIDRQVDCGQPFPLCHNAYWSNPEVWKNIYEFTRS